jgi:hypothetical protein
LTTEIDGAGGFRLAVPPSLGVVLAQAQPGFPFLAEETTWNERDP